MLNVKNLKITIPFLKMQKFNKIKYYIKIH
jgi:hypothetical protein